MATRSTIALEFADGTIGQGIVTGMVTCLTTVKSCKSIILIPSSCVT